MQNTQSHQNTPTLLQSTGTQYICVSLANHAPDFNYNQFPNENTNAVCLRQNRTKPTTFKTFIAYLYLSEIQFASWSGSEMNTLVKQMEHLSVLQPLRKDVMRSCSSLYSLGNPAQWCYLLSIQLKMSTDRYLLS